MIQQEKYLFRNAFEHIMIIIIAIEISLFRKILFFKYIGQYRKNYL